MEPFRRNALAVSNQYRGLTEVTCLRFGLLFIRVATSTPSSARLLSRSSDSSLGEFGRYRQSVPNCLLLRDLPCVDPFSPDWKRECIVQGDGFRKRLDRLAMPQESIHPGG